MRGPMSRPPNFFRDARKNYYANRTGRDSDPRRTIALNTSQWQKLRAQVLAQEPLCRDCHKRQIITPATDVDHISGDPSDNSMDNLQPLCHSCHSIKTARDHGKRVATGCNADGLPDHWKKSPATDRPRPAPNLLFNATCKGQDEND